jgi:hypothetical protein
METEILRLQEACSASVRKGQMRMDAEPIERDDIVVH